jgi:hypothetical protein
MSVGFAFSASRSPTLPTLANVCSVDMASTRLTTISTIVSNLCGCSAVCKTSALFSMSKDKTPWRFISQ